MSTRIAVAGVAGRMGREVAAAAAEDDAAAVAGGTVRAGSAFDGAGWAAAAGVEIPGARLVNDPRGIVPDSEVVIDFTTPAAALAHARVCAEYGVPFVTGTTGFSAEEQAALRTLSRRIPIYAARNMSAGIAALLALLPGLSEALAGYDVEIVETHHRRKLDAPSGTALALAEAIAGDAPLVHGRSGIAPRQAGEIGMHAVRGGGNPGEHSIIFSADGEEVRIQHRAFSRRAYAEGAIRAAHWLTGQQPGWYGPGDLRRPAGKGPIPFARYLVGSERELAGA
ncbi:MAG: 4-hydroxy-tetrahydrodipicolinate reductase [Thermomicrobiales bacterium]